MHEIENFLSMLDDILCTRRRRHIAGGILISLAALFGGLAVTSLTIRPEEKEEDNGYDTNDNFRSH